MAPQEGQKFVYILSIAAAYLERMGFTQNQYVAVRHTDTNHDHLHIVASRIRMDGEGVRDGWDYRRSEATIRALEQHYGLEAVTPSWETERAAPSTGQVRRLKKQEKDYSQGQRDSPVEEIARVKIHSSDRCDHFGGQPYFDSIDGAARRCGHLDAV